MIAARFARISVVLTWALGLALCSPMARSRALAADRPHYALAYSGDPQLCPKLKNLYDRLLMEALRRDSRSRVPVDMRLTDFAVTHGSHFAQIGLKMPAGMTDGPLDGVQFFPVTLDGEPRTLAILDWYRGNSTSTTIGVLKSGVGPLPVVGGMGSMLPVPSRDVQMEVSGYSLAKSQEESSKYPGIYILQKWPNFVQLSAKSRVSASGTRPGPLPAINPNFLGVTVRPFQARDGSLYFVLENYGTFHQTHDLSVRSGAQVLTVVFRLSQGSLRDVCYLVLAPSALAATLETKKVR